MKFIENVIFFLTISLLKQCSILSLHTKNKFLWSEISEEKKTIESH